MSEIRSKVAVLRCEDYSEEHVCEVMKNGIDLIGGIGSFAGPADNILVKPNFLHSSDESRAVTTNPSVIRGMLRILSEAGCTKVKYGDSPAMGSCRDAAAALGLTDGLYGASIADMNEAVSVDFPEGTTAKQFYFAREITEADCIIDLCKMKTHALERITGAVKNAYGFICGKHKAAGHVKYPNDTGFARMLTDIHRAVKPRLHIMDGIVAMEGNGPSSGEPVRMNVMLFSADPVALDTVFCWLVDLDPILVPTNYQGQIAGIGTCTEEDIEVVTLNGEGQEETLSKDELFRRMGNPDFDVPRDGSGSFLSVFSRVVTKLSRPKIDRSKCVHCGVCVGHCPVPGGAVHFDNGRDRPPVYDYGKCIRCYCCQELCPAEAIRKRIL